MGRVNGAPASRCAMWALTSILLAVAPVLPAQTQFSALSSADLYAEACAAHRMGFDADTSARQALGIASAFAMAQELTLREGLTPDLRLKAIRLRGDVLLATKQYDRAQQIYDALPVSIDGVADEEWARLKLLYHLRHLGMASAWDQVREGLATFPEEPPLTGLALADLELLKCQVLTRSSQSSEGYYALARTIVACAQLEIGDPGFGPMFGYRGFLGLGRWPVVKEVLRILDEEGAGSDLTSLRWFEIASPSYRRAFHKFPGASKAERFSLNVNFRLKLSEFESDPAILEPAVGGFRELHAHHMRVHRYIITNRPKQARIYLAGLPATVQDVHDRLWSACKTAWNTSVSLRALAMGEIAADGGQIEEAMELLPEAQFSRLWTALGHARLARFDPEGYTALAQYFAGRRYNARSDVAARAALLGDDPGPTADQVDEILAILTARPDDPGVLATRSIFSIHHRDKFSAEQRNDRLSQAVADGVKALDLMETRRDPTQIGLRSALRPHLADAIGELSGEVARAAMLDSADLTVRENEELNVYLTDEALSLSPVIEPRVALRDATDFEELVERIGEDYESETEGAVLALQVNQFKGALESLSFGDVDPPKLRIATELLDLANSRGREACDFEINAWKMIETQRAELMLGDEATHAEGLETLSVIAADPTIAAEGIGGRAQARASLMVDALDRMATREAYVWAIDWINQIEKVQLEGMGYLRNALAMGLQEAYRRPDSAQYYAEQDADPEIRWHHGYLIGYALTYDSAFSDAEQIFNEVIDSPEVTQNQKVRVRSEQWRLYVWAQQSHYAQDEVVKHDLYRRMVEYSRARFPSMDNEQYKVEMARWALWAATLLDDTEAMAQFEPILIP